MVDLMVARDGVEPPTPAFSGLTSPNRKPLNNLVLSGSKGLKLKLFCHQMCTSRTPASAYAKTAS